MFDRELCDGQFKEILSGKGKQCLKNIPHKFERCLCNFFLIFCNLSNIKLKN